MERFPEVRIVWHHVGREHGLNGTYTTELRLNSPEVVAKYLAEKEALRSPNRCYQHDADTLVELPPAGSDRQWIIVYFLDRYLQFSFGYKRHGWWLADVVSYAQSESGATIVRDLLLDVEIDADLRYRIIDGEEFVKATESGIVPFDEALSAMQALFTLAVELDHNKFPDSRLERIYEQYWPALSGTGISAPILN